MSQQPSLLRAALAAARAASLDDLHESTVDELRRLLGAASATLYRYREPRTLSCYSGHLAEVIQHYSHEYYHRDGCHRVAERLKPRPRVVHISRLTPGWFGSEVYGAFYQRFEMDHVVCTWLNSKPYGEVDMVGIVFYRSARQGDFERSGLAQLHAALPGLSGAAERGLRLERQLEKGALMEAILSADGLRPSLAFDTRGRLLWCSPRARLALPVLPDSMMGAVAKLGAIARGELDALPRTAIRVPLPGESLRIELSLSRTANGQPLVVATLDWALPDVRQAELLAGHYSLTTAEGRVLGFMLAGRSYPSTARELGVSLETVRTHAKRILSKLGVSSRAQLFRVCQEVTSASLHPPP